MYSATDRKIVHFLVCLVISFCGILEPAEIFLFPCEFVYFPVCYLRTDKEMLFKNRQGNCSFPYGFRHVYFRTDKKMLISLCKKEKTHRKIEHTQGKDGFQLLPSKI
jgi:hypothetical protein